ncbi:MAG: hypothetical protein ACOWWM_16510 [Desulfobacterales bacterium]
MAGFLPLAVEVDCFLGGGDFLAVFPVEFRGGLAAADLLFWALEAVLAASVLEAADFLEPAFFWVAFFPDVDSSKLFLPMSAPLPLQVKAVRPDSPTKFGIIMELQRLMQ